MLAGTGSVERLAIDGADVLFSIDRESGQLNAAGLGLATASPKAGALLPLIDLRNGTLRLAEHDADGLDVLREFVLSGSITPTPDPASQGYIVTLRETVSGPDAKPIIDLIGRVSSGGIELELARVVLNDWPAEAVPQDYRELFEAIDIRGSLDGTKFSYSQDTGVSATFEVDNVALSLPFAQDAMEATSEDNPPARLEQVRGTITVSPSGVAGDVSGRLGALPYDVTVDYQGLTLDAPFTCQLTTRGYQLPASPAFVPIAPEVVARRLRSFSNPTALVDADVSVSRGPPVGGVRAPVRVDGELRFRDGTAAFESFPYEFSDLRGVARFTNEELLLEDIQGRSASGAIINATGRIAPPRSGGLVDLDIRVTGAPLDEAMLAAVGERRRDLIEALFNRPRYAELLETGLVISREQTQALMQRATALISSLDRLRDAGDGSDEAKRALADASAELAATQRILDTKPFAFGGLADVRVKIDRPLGTESEYERIITVDLPDAGMVPEQFPLPLYAEDLQLVIDGQTARITQGVFRGLSGGRAEVDAMLDVGASSDAPPRIRVNARGVPIDELLINAIPGSNDAGYKEVLRGLDLAGGVQSDAIIAGKPDGSLGFDVNVNIVDLASAPLSMQPDDPASPEVVLTNLSGSVAVTESAVDMDLFGIARALRDGEAERAGRIALRLDAALTGEDVDEQDVPFEAEVDVRALDLAAPLEAVVMLFSDTAADQLAALRSTREPTGQLRLAADIVGSDAGLSGLELTLDRMLGVEINTLGGRALLEQAGGDVRIRPALVDGGATLANFDRFSGTIAFESGADRRFEQAGVIWAEGEARLGETLEGPSPGGEPLQFNAFDIPLEGALTRRLAERVLPKTASGMIDTGNPRGVFDISLVISPDDNTQPMRDQGSGLALGRVSGSISPIRVSFDRNGRTITADPAWGEITFDTNGGSLRDVGGRFTSAAIEPASPTNDANDPPARPSLTWFGSAEGNWATAEAGVDIGLELSFDSASGLPAGVVALLPSPIDGALDAVKLTADGRVNSSRTRVRVLTSGGDQPPAFEVEGVVAVEDAAVNIGAPIDRLNGRIGFEASSLFAAPGDAPEFAVRIEADQFRLGGVRMTDGIARLESGLLPGRLVVPVVSADAHGGRMSGWARVDTTEGLGNPFEAEFQFSRVALADVLADFDDFRQTEDVFAPRLPADAPEPADASRGRIDASLRLAGRVGDADSVAGRGSAEIGGGTVVRLPLLLPLIEVSNLQVPAGDPLDFAAAQFFVLGDELVFESIDIQAPSVKMIGYGSMSWEDLGLDLRFTSRAVNRVPIVADLIEALRDEVIQTRITGTLGDQQITADNFSGTRELFGRLFGQEVSEAERRLREIQSLVSRTQPRVRRVGDGFTPAAPPDDAFE
ncbi:MAG: hypothetical protein AAF747_03205 [Planctomycetota bacterium]